MMRKVALFAAAALFVVLTSCSTAPPQILQTFWQVTYVHDRIAGTSYERLSLFLHVSIPDGISDLDSIYVLNDKAQLYWKLTPVDWVSSDQSGELWVGSNRIEMPDRSDLPSGSYRVILSNLAGERALGDFFISAEKLNPKTAPFPVASVSNGEITVQSTLSDVWLWVYDLAGQLVGAQKLQSAPVSLQSLLPSGLAGSSYKIYAYGFDPSCGCGLLSGPW